MNIQKWLEKNTSSLSGKVVAITGSTGGLGSEICWYLAKLGANILTLDRNPQKSAKLKNKILAQFPNINFYSIKLNLNSIDNVKSVCSTLEGKKIDYLILNAGIYNVPLKACDSGYNNIFQINFVSHYCLVKGLLSTLKQNHTKVLAVGSIAHSCAKLKEDDLDYSKTKHAIKTYGNAKRFLMFSLYELFKDNSEISFSVVHPGITLTNMTNHYYKAINWFVKLGMKLIFPSPKHAALGTVFALFSSCGYHQWIGPKFYNIWGKPKISNLKAGCQLEGKRMFEIAEQIYSKVVTSCTK